MRGGTTGYYLADAQGSVRALTDPSGAILNTYDYNALGDLYAQTGATINPYLYTGQRYDATTEQYYLRAREYNPVVGRFLSRDKVSCAEVGVSAFQSCSSCGSRSCSSVETLSSCTANNPKELNRYVYTANVIKRATMVVPQVWCNRVMEAAKRVTAADPT
jgi:RHS repeat-associated protein